MSQETRPIVDGNEVWVRKAAGETIVVRAAEIHVGDGRVIAPGEIAFEDGRVVEVGHTVGVPPGAKIIDLAGKSPRRISRIDPAAVRSNTQRHDHVPRLDERS